MAKRKLSRTDPRSSGGDAGRKSSRSTTRKSSARPSKTEGGERPTRKFSDKPFDRKKPSTRFSREDSSERPKRSFTRGGASSGERRSERPFDKKKPFSREGGDKKFSRGFSADSKPRRGYPDGFKREGEGDERPKRNFRSGDAGGKTGGFRKDSDRPFDKRRSFGDRSEGSERPKRNFSRGDSDERPARRTSSDSPREERPFAKRKPFDDRSEGNERPRRTFGKGDNNERPVRRISDDSLREKRPFARRRSTDDRNEGEERPKRFTSRGDSDERPARRSTEDSPKEETPSVRRKTYGDREERNERPRRAFDKADREERPAKNDDDDVDESLQEDKPFERRKPFADREVRGGKERRPRKSFTESKTISSLGYKGRADEEQAPQKMRLNRYLANSGVSSRREADEFIKMGLVTVNGKTITEMGYQVQPGDIVKHEGKMLRAEKPVYILMNKPKGFLTTTRDPDDRNTVMQIIGSAVKERIYPVGRLDRNTTGLLLLTNDGALTEQLSHPSYNVKKIYKVELDRPLSRTDFEKIGQGVQLEEGRAMVDDIAIVSEDAKTVGLEIHIGWNRVVRRIFESLEYQVVKLDRTIYAGLDKKDLSRGQWRFLKEEEVIRLKHLKKGTK